jgi:hypothetical protein
MTTASEILGTPTRFTKLEAREVAITPFTNYYIAVKR